MVLRKGSKRELLQHGGVTDKATKEKMLEHPRKGHRGEGGTMKKISNIGGERGSGVGSGERVMDRGSNPLFGKRR